METDVLIVGGGLSGIAIADHLTRARMDFQLVEAESRLGGRILTEDLFGGAFDLGPAWFWPGQPKMDALVRRLRLRAFEQYSDGDLVFQDRSGAIQRGRGFASMEGSLRIDGGIGALVSALSAQVPAEKIQLESSLQALARDGDMLVADVQGPKGLSRVRTRQVALAVPPRVIAQSVAFRPALTEQQTKAMSQIPTWMAGQAKILAVHDRPYWREAGLSGDAMSQRGPMVEIHDASPAEGGPYALFGFIGVPADIRAAHGDQVLHLALTQLTAMFGEAMAEPKHLVLKDWATVRGIATEADAAPPRGHPGYGLPPELTELWDGKLHLASTETARGFGGFLEGALEAAEVAARRLTAAEPNVA